MPLYVIERNFADQLELTDDDVRLIQTVNGDEGVHWLFSFLSADRRKSYCLYEAPSPEKLMDAAKRANVPADSIIEVSRFTPGAARCAATRGVRCGWFGAADASVRIGLLTTTRMPPIIRGRQAPTHARRDDTSARR